MDGRTEDILRRAGYFSFQESSMSMMEDYLVRSQEAMRRAEMRGSPVYQYVIDHGATFEKIPLTPEETGLVNAIRKKLAPKIGECFRNAMMAWVTDNRMKYCEGFCSALEERIVVAHYHAWNSLNGKLVDLTPPEKFHYFGVMFPDEVTERYVKRAFREWEYTPILDDYVHNWEFLREKGYRV